MSTPAGAAAGLAGAAVTGGIPGAALELAAVVVKAFLSPAGQKFFDGLLEKEGLTQKKQDEIADGLPAVPKSAGS